MRAVTLTNVLQVEASLLIEICVDMFLDATHIYEAHDLFSARTALPQDIFDKCIALTKSNFCFKRVLMSQSEWFEVALATEDRSCLGVATYILIDEYHGPFCNDTLLLRFAGNVFSATAEYLTCMPLAVPT